LSLLCQLGDCRGCIYLSLAYRSIWAERRCEVHTVAGPSRDQPFRIGYSWLSILHDLAFALLLPVQGDQSFLLISYGFIPVMIGLSHRPEGRLFI